jgi:predicted enzyme related to lactoylglutathione lyase
VLLFITGPVNWLFSFSLGGSNMCQEDLGMISGGNATIIVADMDRSIRFYTEILNLKLTNRFGNDWATVSAGEGLTIGIHPASAKYPAPGTKGAIILGLDIDVPIEIAISRLTQRGVTIKGSVTRSDPGNFANLEDPDGNEIYLWEKAKQTASENVLVETAAGRGHGG